MFRVLSVFFVTCLLALAGCSSTQPIAEASPESAEPKVKEPPQTADLAADDVPLFPDALVQAMPPKGWEPWILHPIKRKTEYRWQQDKGGVFVNARSRSSASGLIKRLDIDPAAFPMLQFSWNVDNLLEGADPGLRESEDSPVRVVLAFCWGQE